jgi:signal transduction histidine kinase
VVEQLDVEAAPARGAAAAARTDFALLLHDLRQCVTAAQLLATIPDDRSLDADLEERLRLIRASLRHASGLLDGNGDSAPLTEPADLSQVVAAVVEVARTRHPVLLEVADEAVLVSCHPFHLRRALYNLLDNAIRAAGADGAVRVRVARHGLQAFVEVHDDGPGFALIPSVSGNGLAVVTAAVRECAGTVTIETGPGPGTTVRIAVPISASPARPSGPAHGRPRAR